MPHHHSLTITCVMSFCTRICMIIAVPNFGFTIRICVILQSMDMSCIEDSDSVFEASGNYTSTSTSCSQSIPRPIPLQSQIKPIDKHVRTSSSSSSRKSSSFEDASSKVLQKSRQLPSRRSSARGEAVVISWHPAETKKESVSSTSSRESIGDMQPGSAVNDIHSPDQTEGDIHDCNFSSSGTVTVTIDPPEDGDHFYSSDSKSATTSRFDVSGSSNSMIPFTMLPAEDCDDNEDLYGSLDELESDSDEEGEDERKNPAKVCLLSR